MTSQNGSPQVAAAEFLLSVADEGSSEHAPVALESLAKSRFREEFQERVEGVMRRRGIPPLLC